jgi:tRNA-(ms[2]io[6]A)-hydroxylase
VILSPTNPKWLEVALADFDRVLVDHAHCEKKAAASAMSLVAAYPDRERLVRRLSALAIEELRHFRAVHLRLRRRGLTLGRDFGDPYAQALMRLVRPGRGRLTDRLLVGALIEARSRERIQLLADSLDDSELAAFYRSLAEAEGRHADLFGELARHYDDQGEAETRLATLVAAEEEILKQLPIEPRMH